MLLRGRQESQVLSHTQCETMLFYYTSNSYTSIILTNSIRMLFLILLILIEYNIRLQENKATFIFQHFDY